MEHPWHNITVKTPHTGVLYFTRFTFRARHLGLKIICPMPMSAAAHLKMLGGGAMLEGDGFSVSLSNSVGVLVRVVI